MPERLVIANTSLLLYLYLGGCLELLQKLYRSVTIPPAVRAELDAGRRAGLPAPETADYSWVEVKQVQSPEIIPAIVDLGRGEAEVIALGLENPGSLLIIDDRLARRVAALSHLPLTGTVGVLLKAKQAGLLPFVMPVLERLRESGLWLSDELLAMVLDRAGEARGH